MIYLQDSERASRIFALKQGGLSRLSLIERLMFKASKRRVSGQLGTLSGVPAALYLADGELFLSLQGRSIPLSELRAEILATDDLVYVDIAGGILVQSQIEKGSPDPTPFASLEDRSFELWLANIIRDRKRQKVLKRVFKDAGSVARGQSALSEYGEALPLNLTDDTHHYWVA